MADRYRGYPPPGRANPYGNPARASLPSSVGYTSRYAGDMHVLPAPRQPMTTPRGYATSTNPSGSSTTTRTYGVTHDPRDTRPRRETSRTRRSTLDSAPRPPVIITTSHKDRPTPPTSHSSTNRSVSPYADDYRASDSQFYSQPAPGRSRSSRPHSAVFEGDDYPSRWAERERSDSTLSARDADLYRSSRPTVTYPSDPRHSSSGSAAVDYDDYQYTNAGELAWYDLNHTRPPRARRRESYDKGYYRPAVNYNPDQRTISVNPGQDSGRSYAGRYYDNRGGPPPSTRGFASVNRGYESTRDVPPAAPAPPAPTSASHLDVGSGVSTRRTGHGRPVSLYQEDGPHSVHHDDYYRSQEDERRMRGLPPREREANRTYDDPYFRDDSIGTRGFGIRAPAADEPDDRRDRRRDSRLEDPPKRSEDRRGREENLEREDRDRRRLESREPRGGKRDDRGDRRETKKGSDDEKEPSARTHDKALGAGGLGLAAAAVSGMSMGGDKDEKPNREEREPRRRLEPDESHVANDSDRDASRSRDWDRDRDRAAHSEYRGPKPEAQPSERTSQESIDKAEKDGAVTQPQEAEEPRRFGRAHRRSRSFNPNDPMDLQDIKQELAAMKSSEKPEKSETPERPEKHQEQGDESMAMVRTERSRSSSRSRDREYQVVDAPRDESQSRGRESSISSPTGKQVRVLSPAREPKEERRLKGILKQPRPSFPEEANPVREGVAPHKEDKKLKEAPAGAKWTKISRRIVNPDALTVGKERFEVRDDFVIVLRVLSKEEIQAYAAATSVLRERRRNGEDGSTRDRDSGKDRDEGDDEGKRRHRHRRHKDEEETDDAEDRGYEQRDSERRRRHRREEEDGDKDGRSNKDGEHHHHHHHHHKSYRERERALEV